ncbi:MULTISPECIES: DUF6541 family protein [unclassified Actinomyces]|uniref:DUF6541 family protein n=1 Tax=unclassified Actinomyces TaxID=2609248 RepID=UPI0020182BE2|nr:MULTISPECIES: DUF6541 family protein [unclassified Actinomyces]MCL3776988.1 hypothetical protein [Actinomyces sp. AC-20-1]MCL3789043.1 hypothetical protein [Actinomyces sp. 187325]MCL3791442.1 hypothetical protein [Actinomyces sp. 186855]MCL3794027.1 hypothetical protein [Actinomyces sp. 217892]
MHTLLVLLALALAIALVLYAPGMAILWALRLAPVVVIAAAPAVSVALVTAATTLGPLTGLRWTPVTGTVVLVVATALGAAVGLLRRRHQSPPHAPGAGLLPEVLGTALVSAPATVVVIGIMASGMGRFGSILQNHDALLHLNLISEIAESGNGSLLGASTPINDGAFYPSTFHAVAVLLTPVVSVPTAFNAVSACVVAVLAPVGVAALVRVCGGRLWTAGVGAALACCTMWFPYYLMFFHAQVPAGLAIALIPGALVPLVHRLSENRLWAALAWAVITAAAVGCAHPGGGQWVLNASCLLLATAGARGIARGAHWPARMLLLAGCLAVLVAQTTTPLLRLMSAYTGEKHGLRTRLEQVLLLAPREGGTWLYLPLALLALAGLVLLLRQGRPELPILWATGASLVMLTLVKGTSWGALTGAWWGDYGRYLAVLAVLAAALAALSIQTVVETLLAGRRWRAVVGVLVVVAAVWWNAYLGGWNRIWVMHGYDYYSLLHHAWLNPEEQLALETHTDLFGGTVVYGAPESGAGLIPVLTQGDAVHRHASIESASDDWYIAYHFNELDTDPRVCEIIRTKGGVPVLYADSSDNDEDLEVFYPGYVGIDTSTGFELLAELGTTSVFRITACD